MHFLVEEPNNKDVMELDNGNHVMDNNLSDAAFSDEEDDMPLGKFITCAFCSDLVTSSLVCPVLGTSILLVSPPL